MTTPARALALSALLRFEGAGQYANLTLSTALEREGSALSPADRALFTALFYSVIEHKITLDAVIDSLSSLPPSAIEAQVRMILRLALAQLLYFDRIPDSAAVNEAVSAAPRRSAGFVNALLRQFLRNQKAVPLPDEGKDPVGYLSVRFSVTRELAALFLTRFGASRTRSLLEAFEKKPEITVRVNTQKLSRETFLARVPGSRPTVNAPYGVILPAGADLSALLSEGICFVQDEASQIAVAALEVGTARRAADLCAAPGSKSFGIAMDMKEGSVYSADLHENKLSLIRAGAARLGLANIEVHAGDARRAREEIDGTFDRVLCDVPCSGLGVLAKKPDLRYKDLSGIGGLLPVQSDILRAGAALTAPGGFLLYSTCTLLPEENEEQVTVFLAGNSDFSLSPFRVGWIECDGMYTLAPDREGTDGFFVARLRKRD